MRALALLVAAIAASLALFVAVFSVLQRPLTLGDIARQLAYKHARADSLTGPRIIVFAGSNGRYSHRCAAFAEALGRPCVNMSVAVGVGLDFLLDDLLTVLREGDVVYMPLEYAQYAVGREEMEGGHQNPLLVQQLRGRLFAMPWPRIVRAYGYFDLPHLVHGLIETALSRTGFQRRTSLASLTPEGDERGHTAAAGAEYRSFLQQARFDSRPLPADSHAVQVLMQFLHAARERGVRVVGGLPTVPENVPLREEELQRIQRWFEQADQGFVRLPNQSQYPLACFFDTLLHLNEECQRQHSREVAARLGALLSTG